MPKSSRNRAAVKNGRRLRRKGAKPWMKRHPLMKKGAGGTDKGGKNYGKAPTYSQAPAMGPHGRAFR